MQVGTDFVHVILTRFNLATPGRESAIRNQPGWLAGRFELFERYCLPTLAAQRGVSAGGFRWIVYFDDGTPEPFRARIEACRRVADFHPFFTPIFPGEQWGISARAVLAAEGRAAPWLLSTRLDNDDGLAVDFVAARAGGGRRRRAAARRLQPDQRLRLRRPARLRPRPSEQRLRQPARALGDGAHRLGRPAHGPRRGRAGRPGRRPRRLAAGGARRQRLEQDPRPPGAAGRARRPLPGRRSTSAPGPRRSASPPRTCCSRRCAARATAPPAWRAGCAGRPEADILFLFLPRGCCCNSGKNIPSEGTCLRVRVRSSPLRSGRHLLKSSLRCRLLGRPSIAGNAVTRRGKLSFTC